MKICIESQQDGTFSVYDEAAAPAQPPGQSGMGGETAEMAAAPAPAAQTAATTDEALEIARQMLGGGATQPGGADKSPEALFEGGFKKARGVPAGY